MAVAAMLAAEVDSCLALALPAGGHIILGRKEELGKNRGRIEIIANGKSRNLEVRSWESKACSLLAEASCRLVRLLGSGREQAGDDCG